jgi:hypothetical protein
LRPEIFELDQKMREALPDGESFSYVSLLDAICPHRQCPLTVADHIPLTVDHAHLTANGSAYVSTKLLPELDLKRKKGPAARIGQAGHNNRRVRATRPPFAAMHESGFDAVDGSSTGT